MKQDATYQNLTKDFSFQELRSLESKQNLEILHKIANLKLHTKICFNVLDSKLSACLWGMQHEVSTEAIKQALFLAQKPSESHLSNFKGNSRENLLSGLHFVFEILPLESSISSHTDLGNAQLDSLYEIVSLLKPWRKGPFYLHINVLDSMGKESYSKLFIDSEWQSFIKMELLLKTFEKLNYEIKGKDILDVGCNNGYYMFDLALRGVKHIVGIDPVGIFFLQFYFLFKLTALSNISYRLLGVQDIEKVKKEFDCILCLGVLYHRQEPLQTLKILKKKLKSEGILILETLIIDSPEHIALLPYPTYAKMANVFYIFSPSALHNLALRAGFNRCELVSFSYTANTEQRSTDFIDRQSLGDFLESDKTIEGYPPVCRGIFVLQL
ncbi:tRNA 5-methoxyuridine(34)/uridine 5-oxyacetic acid(34) synthase CmoB [Helicobacter sp. MIT 14-3879]|uniref:tRNA 5-methoxyuridine(34)/uridine 5-oxyacetic acid(34) synthase CmoB n=1 Tax=Helicobacter sp. MIT 14-3879 TaxID=2040649 RepID=UPI000E1F7430|nr:tRNA 5-methoxyuridine(34)/uridine 5-oxyacetic acid(34) synthase CmoB [Helicobacter sp. MIT 14-3879]RDU61369.1 tRNA 5-methoxyuridine(34)/uridine 5-oxyacetic acid(34) synthase CmoB [Helicobacter sp. MIT 14-3879]